MFSTPDILRLRAETPGANGRIHFNNAGAALAPASVHEAIRAHLELEARIGGYEAAAQAREAIEAFYPALARLIGARARNIAYCASATDAYNRALSSIPFQAGDVVLTTTDDYVSNQIAFLQIARRFGVRVVRAEDQKTGGVDLDSLAQLMDEHRPRLVAVTHVPATSGLVQPVAEIGRLCRERELFYLVDACQSVGQLQVNVQETGCDFLSATFRKFLRGPRGAGFLYVSDRVLSAGLEPLFLDLHSARWTGGDRYEPLPDARRFELWERPYALLLGARAAAEYALTQGLPAIEARAKALAAALREKLAAVEHLRVLDWGRELGAIVTFTADNWEANAFKEELDQRHINSSVGWRHFARLDFARKGVDWVLRASPHYYNTEEEIDTFAAVVRELAVNSENNA
jgi:selenocysteine lyase/cysteine desulfurase